jgi:hypothetical protein
MNDLVERLSSPTPVMCMRPEKSASALQESIDRNYVHLLFTKTGTELGVQLYKPACSLHGKAGNTTLLELVGGLTLNYVKVKCIAEINSTTCEGVARLVPIDNEEYRMMLTQ